MSFLRLSLSAARWVLPLVVVIAAGGAVVVSPVLGAGRDPVPKAALAASDPGIAAGLRRDRARRDRLGGAAARAERARSRERYRGLGRSDALAVGRKAFPDELSGRLFEGREPSQGFRLVRSLGARTGLVQDAKGRRMVVQSALPLQTPNAAGRSEPVDLSLSEKAASFDSVNALTPLRVAKRVRGGVSFDRGAFAVRPASDSDVSGVEKSDRVFFAGAREDTDVVVAPRAGGAEVGWVLRSAQSPETLVLSVDLPAGAVLRRARSEHPIAGDRPDAIEIAKGDKALGYVYPPNVYDSDGRPVRSSARIDGDRVVIAVKHRGADVRYPLFADPEVFSIGHYTTGWSGWYHAQSPSSASPGSNYFGVAANDCAYYCGLYMSMPTHTFFSPTGTGVIWSYPAPANTYVYTAAFGNMAHAPLINGYTFSRWDHGILAASGNWEPDVHYINTTGQYGPNPFGPASTAASGVGHTYCFGYPPSSCDHSRGSAGNRAILGLIAQNDYNGLNIYTGEAKATVTMESAVVALGDRHPPTITSPRPSDRAWTDDTDQRTHRPGRVSAHDDGLGLNGITLTGAATGNATLARACNGDPTRSPCDADYATDAIAYTLPEGISTLGLQARDIVDNTSAKQTWTEKIDRSKPTFDTPEGTLFSHRDALTEGKYSMSIAAHDGDNATDATRRSGVKSVDVRLERADGSVAQDAPDTSPQGCPGDSCSKTRSFELDTGSVTDGDYTVVVTAKDQLGHAASYSLKVTVNRSPSADGSGLGLIRGNKYETQDLTDRLSLQVNVSSGNLLLRATDLTIPGGLGPDLQVARTYNSKQTAQLAYGQGWGMDSGPDVKIDALPNGDVVYHGPSGLRALFVKLSDTTYRTPAGFNVMLTHDDSGYVYTEHKSQRKLTFDGSGRLTRDQDRNNRAISFTYTGAGAQLEKITDSQGRDTTFGYTNGQITQMTDPAGRGYRYAYDSSGRLTGYTDPEGGVTTIEWGADGPTLITTPAGRKTKLTYSQGRVESVMRVTNPAVPAGSMTGPTTSFAYTSGQSTVTDPRGSTVKTTFDSAGRSTEAVDGLGRKTKRSYTTNSNMQDFTLAGNTGTTPSTSLSYDADDNLTGASTPTTSGGDCTIAPATCVKSSARHGTAGGVPSSVAGYRWLMGSATNEQGHVTALEYDTNGNPTAVRSQLGSENQIALTYDPNSAGKLDKVTDQRGKATGYGYDGAGNLSKITPPAPLGETTLTYTSTLSRVSSVTDGKGQQRTLSYDNLDRVTKIARSRMPTAATCSWSMTRTETKPPATTAPAGTAPTATTSSDA